MEIPPDNEDDTRAPRQDELKQNRACFDACVDPVTEEPLDCPPESSCGVIDPVCGATGPGPKDTYESECILNIKACKAGHAPIKLYSGECHYDDETPAKRLCERDGPIKINVKYHQNTTLEECFGPVTEVMACNGMLCEGTSATCCGVVEQDPVEVTVSCYRHYPRQFSRTLKHIHYSATSCKCMENPDV